MILAIRAASLQVRCGNFLRVAKTFDQRMYLTCSPGRWDHYKTLGIPREATQEEIENAYFKLASKLHANSITAPSRKMEAVLKAYETLSDDEEKKLYDANDYVKEVLENVSVENTQIRQGGYQEINHT